MLISVTFEKPNHWGADENICNCIPEIRAVLNKPTQGIEAVVVIAYLCDPLSPIVEAFEGNPERIKKEAFRAVYKDKFKMEDFFSAPGIQEAIDTYREWCDTPISRIVKIQKESIVEASKRLKSLAKDGATEELLESLKAMPLLVKQYMEAGNTQRADTQDVKSKVKGERPLTRAERRDLDEYTKKRK